MADSATIPQDRVRIFDRDGSSLAEFRTSVERSWAIADEWRAMFRYSSRKTDIVNERVLQFGNWLLVENDTLPPWVGVIDTPREWTPRAVTVYAYGPEHVMGWRRGPLEVVLTGSAGTIFEQLLRYTDAPEATILTAGNIWRGGTQRQETINPTPLSENLKRIQQRSREEYTWRPETDAKGRLVVYGDWMYLLGIDTTALLHEGIGGGNVEAVENVLVEDGPIINDTLGYGDGASWKSVSNVVIADSVASNAASVEKYGRRQDSVNYSGVTALATLTANAKEHTGEFNEPKRNFHVNAINLGDTFKYMDLGNRLSLQFENIGFFTGGQGLTTRVRIVGMTYDPQSKNKLELVVEEYNV